MFNRVKHAVTDYAPTRGICLILGIGMLVWGVWVLLPFTAFTSEVYAFMLRLAVEGVWGALFTFGGFTMVLGALRRDADWLTSGAFIGFALWMTIAILGLIAEPSATPIVTRGIIAAMHAWVYLQVKVNHELVTGEITMDDLRKAKADRLEQEIKEEA